MGPAGARGGDVTAQDAEQAIAQELDANERLLWAGVPRQGFTLRGSDAFMIPFSLMWGGFAIFWETAVVGSKAPIFFMLWGIPFVLMGLYIMFGRFFVDAWQRGATAYGITDRRVVISSGLLSRNVKSVALRTMSDVALSERRDGSGTIQFGSAPAWSQWFAGTSWPGSGAQRGPAFDMIEDAKTVYARVRSAQSDSQRAAG
jgi:hypothetical protein